MQEELLKTPLYDLHLDMGAKMVPFAGFLMPVQYPLGVKKEHLHCREHIGIFDVSHMGQIRIRGDKAAKELEKLLPIDLEQLEKGRQKYAFFTNEKGGILDDLMISKLDDGFFLVVNAAKKAQDIAHLKKHLNDDIQVEVLENQALIAIQGPKAYALLYVLNPDCEYMRFLDIQTTTLAGFDCVLSRAGYTGEDGFEISLSASVALDFVSLLLTHKEVQLIGLGARDSLRLEAGLCLYGHDIDAQTTPIEAGLQWAISPSRRHKGGFIGDKVILSQVNSKELSKIRVGLVGQSKAPVREGTLLVDDKDKPIGKVTSGTFSPTREQAIAMAYINPHYAQLGQRVFAKVRNKNRPMTVEKMPFVSPRYYRGE